MLSTLNIDALGEDFSGLNTLTKPEEVLESLIANIGKLFNCERVYICEKNKEGSYDCTNEWVVETSMPKKHLLRDIPPQGVKYYYRYFKEGRHLSFDDIETFNDQDPALYTILKPQGVQSLLSMQLSIDGKDLGFMGIDNPSPEKYGELKNIAEIIGRYISIQIHQRNLKDTLEDAKTAQNVFWRSDPAKNLPGRLLQLSEDRQFAVVYFEVTLKNHFVPSGSDLIERISGHTERILNSAFGAPNIFRLDEQEFLAVVEDTEDMDISKLEEYVAAVSRTLDVIGIFTFTGSSSVRTYSHMSDFFEMVYSANAKMLQHKKKYRDFYTGKYHLETESNHFRELLEIYPDQDVFEVLYSEFEGLTGKRGRFSAHLTDRTKEVYGEDRQNYKEFWEKQLALAENPDMMKMNPPEQQIRFRVQVENRLIWMKLSVASYTRPCGETTMLCYIQ